jgi:hypothetical protein
VFLWSAARIAGVPLGKLIDSRGETLEQARKQIEQDVRYANITIIEGNEASEFGIGIVSTRIAEMVLRDERAVIPIGSYSERFGVTLSLPSIVGRGGVIQTFETGNVARGAAGLGARRRQSKKIDRAILKVLVWFGVMLPWYLEDDGGRASAGTAGAVPVIESAVHLMIGAVAPRAVGRTVSGCDGGLRRIAITGARGVTAEYPGGANHRTRRIGCKVSGKEAIGREVADIVAAIEKPDETRKAALAGPWR